jgi:hypothetical protein
MIRPALLAGLLAAGLASTPALGQDDAPKKTRTVSAEGIQFAVPEAWESARPTSAMRKAQIRIQPAEGDSAPAELVLFVFPGGAGGVDDNVERWRKQFADADGDAPEVETAKVPGKNVEVTRVETGGTYTDPFSGAGARKGYKLLGAIVVTDQNGYFFKLIGPEKTVDAIEKDFDAMLATMELAGK